jgi:tRNA wybutosine-synthesizing protein 4
METKPRSQNKPKPNSEHQNVLSVARTNDDAVVSKRSAARSGYFADEYLAHFVKKPSRRSGLINRGYYIRVHAVREALRRFIAQHGGKCQVLSLGAGFDTSFFVLAAEGVTCHHYYEMDFPTVVQNKCTIIQHTPELQSLLGVDCKITDTGVSSNGYTLVAGDLTHVGALGITLQNAKLNPALPTLVLTECVLTYMSPQDSSKVIYWARTHLPLSTIVCYEQIRPLDAFGRVMCANLESRGSPLLGVYAHQTVESQEKRFRDIGYPNVRVETMWGIWQRLSVQERARIEEIEEFDEHEEWVEKCSHYVVITASPEPPAQTGCCSDVEEARVPAIESKIGWTTVEYVAPTGRVGDLRLWGHSAIAVADSIIVFGGYGGAHRHERTNALSIIDCGSSNNHRVSTVTTRGSAPSTRVLHAACLIGTSMLVHGGRAGPATALSDVFTLDIVSHEWRLMDIKAPARYRHTMTAIPNTHLAIIYGGKSDWHTDSFCGNAYLLDLKTKSCAPITWQQGAPVPPARASHCAVWLADALYVYGGVNNDGVMSDLWRVQFTDSSYTNAIATQLIQVSLPPRFAHGAVTMNGNCVYFIGGYNRSHCNSVICLESLGGTTPTTALTVLPVESGVELISRSQYVLLGNRVYGVGGGLTCFSFGSTFAERLVAFTFGDLYKPPPPQEQQQLQHQQQHQNQNQQQQHQQRVTNLKKQIAHLDNPTPDQFRDWVDRVREPCIVRGDSIGVPRWTKSDIANSIASDTRASVHVCTGPLLDFANKNYVFEVIGFAEMLERIDDPAEHLYFRSLGANARKDPSNVSESFPKLAQQFLVPEFAKALVEERGTHSSCLRFSSPDIQMWTHYDINDNLLCGLRGRKRLLLYHPEEVKHLYVDGTSSLVLNVDEPDLVQFPKFAKAVALEGILEEGEVLFIPAMWFHNVRTLTPCYGLNVFFHHLPQSQYQTNDLYGNRDPVAAHRAEKSMHAAVEQLRELPEDYRRFFAQKFILDMKKSMNL